MSDREPSRFGTALVLTVLLYALWGLAHNLNDILIAQFKRAFSLTDLQSSLVQSCFYVAYLIMPLPVALFMQRFGYKAGVMTGLCLYGTGALLFWPAADTMTYGAFLGALFVIACGLTFVETAGTGIVVVLGSPERAEWRINLAQAFNPIGAVVGVLAGRHFIFTGDEVDVADRATLSYAQQSALRLSEAQAVQMPYLIIAIAVFAVGALVAVTRFPASATQAREGSPLSGLSVLLRSKLFLAGVVAQFFYVGAQIGVWSFLIRYAKAAVPGISEREAALYLTISLILFLVGRLGVLMLLRRWSSAQIAAAFATCAAALMLVTIVFPGLAGLLALTGTGLFMSVMFPAIYAIGLHDHAERSQAASALMIMAIVGGAVLTAAMGAVSDRAGIAAAYTVPLLSFLIVFAYCLAAVRAGRIGAAFSAAH